MKFLIGNKVAHLKKELSENQEEELILQYLSKRGGQVRKVPQTGYYDSAKKTFRKQVSTHIVNGVSDISYLENGNKFVFEVKRKSKHDYIKRHLFDIMKSCGIGLNKSRKAIFDQAVYIEATEKNGGFGGFVSSIEDVIKILNRAPSTGKCPKGIEGETI